MTISVERFPTRAAWLAARRPSLGGSDAAVVAGVSAHTSEFSLAAEKRGLLPPEDGPVPEWIEAGNWLEPVVLAWWAHRSGEKAMEPTPLTVVRNSELPFLHASPDAFVGDDEGLDAKTTSEWNAEDWKDGKIPLAYQIQGMHYLAVTGRKRWHFACLVGGNRLKLAAVDRDEAFIERLVAAETAWWTRYVVGGETPAPDSSESSGATLRRLWPREVEGETRPLGDEFLALRERLDVAKQNRKDADAVVTEIENTIKAALGPAERGVLPDGGAWTWKAQDRAEYVVKASTFRVLRYQAPKGGKGEKKR